jgi:hypothetical protein
MGGSIGLEFLVAPNLSEPLKSAFFVGGNVTIPAILIQTPPTPSSPPIPLFNIVGFSGGFGLNVAPKQAGVGLIKEPENQLKPLPGSMLLQAGILLADPAPGPATGKIWWADTTLTLTINPVTVDLTARASFLDMQGYDFLSLSEWKERDRIAEVYMNLDLGTPAFTVGGSADLTFPTRAANLAKAEGEAQLRIAKNEAYIRIGWEEAGQKPLKLTFLEAFEGIADISAQAGMEIDFKAASAEMFLEIVAEISVPGAEIDGKIDGSLTLKNIGKEEFNATGTLGISASVDFGFFSARGEGRLDAQFNTPGHRKELYLKGTISGEVAGFEGSASVELPLKAG